MFNRFLSRLWFWLDIKIDLLMSFFYNVIQIWQILLVIEMKPSVWKIEISRFGDTLFHNIQFGIIKWGLRQMLYSYYAVSMDQFTSSTYWKYKFIFDLLSNKYVNRFDVELMNDYNVQQLFFTTKIKEHVQVSKIICHVSNCHHYCRGNLHLIHSKLAMLRQVGCSSYKKWNIWA